MPSHFFKLSYYGSKRCWLLNQHYSLFSILLVVFGEWRSWRADQFGRISLSTVHAFGPTVMPFVLLSCIDSYKYPRRKITPTIDSKNSKKRILFTSLKFHSYVGLWTHRTAKANEIFWISVKHKGETEEEEAARREKAASEREKEMRGRNTEISVRS